MWTLERMLRVQGVLQLWRKVNAPFGGSRWLQLGEAV